MICIHEKILLVGDFNAEDTESCLSNFLNENNLVNIVKTKTCFKSKNNPSCIDLFITNCPKSFQNTIAVTTGLSDFHKMIVSVLKKSFKKNKPKVICYKDYKNLNREEFTNELVKSLDLKDITSYSEFKNSFMDTFNRYVPIKKKTVRANHAPYVTKHMRKAIMKRTNLQNKYFKKRTLGNLRAFFKVFIL